MDISTIFSLGKIGRGLFGAFSAKASAENRRSHFEELAMINRQIGQFNSEIASRTGVQQAQAISIQTRRKLGEEIVAFGNRGIELDGSPLLVMQETVNAGGKAAQEAYFNASVNKQNALYSAYASESYARDQAETSKYQAKQALNNIFEQFAQGISLGNSMFKASTPAKMYNTAATGAKNNIYDRIFGQ